MLESVGIKYDIGKERIRAGLSTLDARLQLYVKSLVKGMPRNCTSSHDGVVCRGVESESSYLRFP